MTDVELLRIEQGTIWKHDEHGRLEATRGRTGAPAPRLAIGTARDGRTVAIGSDVPDGVATDLRRVIDAEPRSRDPAEEPRSLAACEVMLRDALGPLERSVGRAWIIESVPASTTYAQIIRSTDAGAHRFSGDVPAGFSWEPDEWRELMSGNLGRWAMCAVGGVAVSLCFSSRVSDEGMEAGVWTHPDHRGCGYAAASTAAWASLVLPSGRHVFYSINAENLSSERVTKRLNLRPIGWHWILSPAASSSS